MLNNRHFIIWVAFMDERNEGSFLVVLKNGELELLSETEHLLTTELNKKLASAILKGERLISVDGLNGIYFINELDEKDHFEIFPIGAEDTARLRELFMGVLDKLNDGLMISDKEGRIIVYNSAMEKLENMTREDMIGKYLWDAYGYEDDSTSEHRHVFKSGKALENMYSAHTLVDGDPLYTNYSTYPIFSNGEIIGVVTVSGNEEVIHERLRKATEVKRLHNVNYNLQTGRTYSDNGTTYGFSDFIGESEIIKSLINEAQTISWMDNNILIHGETGTGKEVLAQSIHNHGKRSKERFIGVNCSAIPENLLESILFGTVKGAYTGAVDHAGIFEEVGEGTLFLDEVNSMPITLQVKLLRVLQERRVTRLGDTKSYELKARVISAMNQNPFEAIKEGIIREDLYYRLAGFNLHIPALRDRKSDIILLLEYFLKRYSSLMGKKIIGIDDELRRILTNYTWKGNIRELENLVENMLIAANPEERYLTTEHIPKYLKKRILGSSITDDESNEDLITRVEEFEKKIIQKALEENSYNITRTSKKLGLIRQNLLYRMKKYNIEKPEEV